MKIVVANDVIENVRFAHTVTDATFSSEQLKEVEKYFKCFKPSNKGKKPIAYSAPVYCLDSSRWSGVVDGLFERNKDLKLIYGNKRTFFVVFELVATEPGYIYKWHRDVSRKAITGVVYWGNEGEGTILKTPEGESQVKWNHNRALWFGNHRDDLPVNDPLAPWHRFENTSSKMRYSVNINFTPEDEIMEYVREKKKQFLYFWNHQLPLWMKMGRE